MEPISYQRETLAIREDRRRSRRRRWITLVIVLVAVVTAAWLAPRAWRSVRAHYIWSNACQAPEPIGLAVTGTFYRPSGVYSPTAVANSSRPDAEQWQAWGSSAPIVYCHGRTDPENNTVLVRVAFCHLNLESDGVSACFYVTATRSDNDEVGVGFIDVPLLAPNYSDPKTMQDRLRRGVFQMNFGRSDLVNPRRFTLDYTFDGRPGSIVGKVGMYGRPTLVPGE